MASWIEQIIQIAVQTISKMFSAEVVANCIALLDQIAKDDAVLLKLATSLHHFTRDASILHPVKPGFVIRTKRLLPPQWKKVKELEKVYINVFHHESIAATDAFDGNSGDDENEDEDKDDVYVVDNSDELNIVVVSCTESSVTEDSEGSPCLLYNVTVSSKYFSDSNLVHVITSPQAIQQVHFN